MFFHNVTGKIKHQHETVAEARLCEQGRMTTTTVIDKSDEVPVYREAHHQNPCVCGPYDRCWEMRVATARTWRDLFRAYND
jgi:hypothetical protein